MAQQIPYIDLGTLKAYLNISNNDTSKDAFLTFLIPQVQGFIENYTLRTFGWGDTGDNSNIDYSNTDNIGVLSYTQETVDDTNYITITTMGPAPWIVGQNVSLFGFQDSDLSGVFQVTAVPNAITFTINVSVQTGTLSLSDIENEFNPDLGTNYAGYIGNAVKNYRYISQEQHDGLVGKTIYLFNMDIRSVDTLFIGLRNIAQPVLLNHTQYVHRDDGRIILGGAYFNSYDSAVYAQANDNSFYGTVAAGYQTITVSYWCGYIGVPPEIQLAALDLCAAMYILRRSLGIQREQAGDYTVMYDLTLRKALQTQPDSLNTLNRYRRVHI